MRHEYKHSLRRAAFVDRSPSATFEMAYVEDFIFYHEQLLQGELTPLLKNEIEQALNAAQALQQEAGMTNTQDYSGLELRVQRIDEHWKQIFCDPRTKALTFYKIASFRETLACKLCEDYLGISFEVPPTTVRLAQRQVYDSAAAELMLDAGHVQLRLSLIIARDGAPGEPAHKFTHLFFIVGLGSWQVLQNTSSH